MQDSEFRRDVANFQWTVADVKEQAAALDSPFGPIGYRDRWGLPTRGPSPRALRAAKALIEDGSIGRHVVDRDLVVSIDGLGDRDRVSLLEGPNVGDDEAPEERG